MKKVIIALFGILLFIPVVYSVGDEDILYSYTSPSLPVLHFGTNQPVTLPKDYIEYEREMRGVWVATVFNIDMPKQTSTGYASMETYKREFIKVLDTMETYNMNTIFFQIRPSNDAFYPSNINPWSEFLVGHGIDPGWDPLEWMIDQTHKRGFAFHAWMNAYRVTPSKLFPEGTLASSYSRDELIQKKHETIKKLHPSSFASLYPEYVIMGERDTKLILNPGEPAVINHIANTVSEIIKNYNIDGLHFDDYFYLESKQCADPQTNNCNFAPYEFTSKTQDDLNDLRTYQKYLQNPIPFQMQSGYSYGEFRRESVNRMIQTVSEVVNQYNLVHNRAVEFGSKPAAVWQSNTEYCTANPRTSYDGSNTHCYAYSSNYDLFADSKRWVEEGWVAYVAPQVYYAFESHVVPYADIVDWWVDVVSKANSKLQTENKPPVKLYIAHGIYKFADFPEQFANPFEFVNQLRYNRKHTIIEGSAVFAYNDLVQYGNQTHRSAMEKVHDFWKNPTLPTIIHLDVAIENSEISNLTIQSTLAGYRLDWESTFVNEKYAVFRTVDGIESFIGVIYSKKDSNKAIYLDQDVEINQEYQYRIVELNKKNELGSSKSIHTREAIEGGLIEINAVENIWIIPPKQELDSWRLYFHAIEPTFGGALHYQVWGKSNDKDWELLSNENNPIKSYLNYLTVELPIEDLSMDIKIVTFNDIGYSESNTFLAENINIRRRMLHFTMLEQNVSAGTIVFQWWSNKEIANKPFQLQYSVDEVVWIDVPINPMNTGRELLKRVEITAPNEAMKGYYRVVSSSDQTLDVSSIIAVEVPTSLAPFEMIRVNGAPPKPINKVKEMDTISITWNNHHNNALYVAMISNDLVHWRAISSPHGFQSSINYGDIRMTHTFQMGYVNYGLYYRIDAISPIGNISSPILSFVIELEEHYLRDLLQYIHFEQQSMLNKLSIYG